MKVDTTAATNRFGYLDTLRFVGASIVAYFHFLACVPSTPAIHAYLASGFGLGAVMIFFIISGYVMPFTVKRGVDLRDFAIRRAFRLFPLYYVAIALLFGGVWIGLFPGWAGVTSASPMTWVANLLIVQDFVRAPAFIGVSWTLGLEIIWYIIFFAALALWGKKAPFLLGVLAPIGMLTLAGASLALDFRLPLGRAAMLYAAALGWQLYSYSTGDMNKRSVLLWTALFIVVTLVTNFVSFGHFHHPRIALYYAVVACIGGPIIFAAVILWPRLQQLPGVANGPLPAIGIMSYSLYLLHPFAGAATLHLLPGAPVLWQILAYTLATAVLTTAGYCLVELPAIELGRRVAARYRKPIGEQPLMPTLSTAAVSSA